MKKLLLAAVAGVSMFAAAGTAMAAPTVLFQTDFNTGSLLAGVNQSTTGGGGTVNIGAGPYGGAANNIWHNSTVSPIQSTTWTLTNIGAHSSIIVDFDALFIDSWDSTNGSPAPDYFDVYFDNVLQLRMTSNNASGNVNFFGTGTQTFFGNIPVFNGSWSDRVVDMNTGDLTIAHTASTFALRIEAAGAGWQGTTDESWGIDNLVISAELTPPPTGGVPEPATWAMMIGGFAGMGAMLRRRRTAIA